MCKKLFEDTPESFCKRGKWDKDKKLLGGEKNWEQLFCSKTIIAFYIFLNDLQKGGFDLIFEMNFMKIFDLCK